MAKETKVKKCLLSAVFLVALLWGDAAAEVIYVDADALGPTHDGTTWTYAYLSLQDALNKPPTGGDEIWVADGTYKPTTGSDRTATFQLINGVALYGGFAGIESSLDERDWATNVAILSGDIGVPDANSDNSYHVVTAIATDANTTLDGFTIAAGNANSGSSPDSWGGGMYNYYGSPAVANCTFSGNSAGWGGGMFNDEYSSPTVRNCTFSVNWADYDGGGMCSTYGTNPTVANCIFSGNSAGRYGGGMENVGVNSSLTVSNCTFSGNSAAWCGGGMENLGLCSPTVTNCTFSGNSAGTYGGGMENYFYSNPTITNCIFSGNSADYGGGMDNYHTSNPLVTNCTFSANSADSGGGMYNKESSPTVTNCTFIGSSADRYGGGMYNFLCSPTVMNNTFIGNSASSGGGMFNDGYGNPTVTNCTFSGNSTGESGGGMSNYNSSPTVMNCTFSANSADSEGGGMFNEWDSSAMLTNCILWGNTAASGGQIRNDGTSSTTVSYSDVQGGWGDTGNIDADPLFVDPNGPDDIPGTADDNLRLSAGSLCIDAGDNTSVPADTADLDGDGNTSERTPLDLNGFARFIDDLCTTDTGLADPPDYPEIVDMGAYEFLRSDINSNGNVNFVDFAVLGAHWRKTSCGVCGGADLTCDGNVDWDDLKEFVASWLAGM